MSDETLSQKPDQDLLREVNRIKALFDELGGDDAEDMISYAKYVISKDAEIARLKALHEWQPIETAPKDETEILAVCTIGKPDYSIVYWTGRVWRAMSDGVLCIEYQDYGGTDYLEPHVTHWLPLPSPPTEGEGP